jgi:hypothetical protein
VALVEAQHELFLGEFYAGAFLDDARVLGFHGCLTPFGQARFHQRCDTARHEMDGEDQHDPIDKEDVGSAQRLCGDAHGKEDQLHEKRAVDGAAQGGEPAHGDADQEAERQESAE